MVYWHIKSETVNIIQPLFSIAVFLVTYFYSMKQSCLKTQLSLEQLYWNARLACVVTHT